NEPVAGAQISLTKVSATSPSATTTADAQGKFTFIDVEAGAYRLIISRDGYVRETGAARILNVAADQTLKDVFRLTPTGSVNGRITNSAGERLMGMEVTLLRLAYDSNGRKSFQI